MAKTENIFNAGQWLLEIITTLGAYRTISDFILDENAQSAHLNSREIVKYSMKDEKLQEKVCKDKKTIKLFHDNIINSIKTSSNFYNRQIIVLASTYVELMLKDFLSVFFKKFPERMYEVIYDQDKQHNKGNISLKEIIKVKNIDELFTQLANQATSNLLTFSAS
jgi:hypothetical protein